MNKTFIVLLFCAFILVSCTYTPICINKGMIGATVDWGTIESNDSTKARIISGYLLNHSGIVKKYQTLKDSTFFYNEEMNIEEEIFCSTFSYVRQQIITTQTLFEPGNDQHFIRYKNPNFNVDVRVVWNSEFKTAGSEKARAAFDSLNVLIENISK